MANNRVVLTPEFRMSFPNLIKAKPYVEKGKSPDTAKFSYSVEGIFPEASLVEFQVLRDGALVKVNIQDVLVELAREKWGSAINPETQKPWTIKEMFAGVAQKGWPLKRGDVIADGLKAKGKNGEQYRGMRVIPMKSNVSDKVQPPSLGIAQKGGAYKINRLVEADMDKARQAFVGGNYAMAELNISASEVGGMKYLTAYINLVRYTREGPKLGGGGGALMERYDGVNGGSSSHDPTEGLVEEEVPF